MKFIRSISLVLLCFAFVPMAAIGQTVKPEMFWWHNLNEKILENTLIGNDGNLYVNVNNNKIYSFSPAGNPVSALYDCDEDWKFKEEWKSKVIEVDRIRVGWGFGQFDWEEVEKAFVRQNGSIYVKTSDGRIYDLKLGIYEWTWDGPDEPSYSTYNTSGSGGSSRSSKLDTDEINLFIGSSNKSIFAVNPDGTIKWEYKLNKKIYSNPVIGLNEMVYFGCDDKKLYALTGNGKKKWEFVTGGRIQSAPFIGKEGTIYVGSSDSYLYAINQDGSKKWEFKTGDEIKNSPVVGSDGTIYVGSSDSYLYAINEDGSKEWEFKTGGAISNSPALGNDGTIYIASDDYNLYALNREGVNKWLFYFGSPLSSLNIDKNNNIFIGTNEGRLFGMKVNSEISGGVKIVPDVFGAEPAVSILSVQFDPLLNKSKTQPGGKISMHASYSGFETHLGPEKVNYKWRKNGVLLNHNNSSLIIESATNQDSGEYTVKIISESKSALSKSVMVIVSDPTAGDALWKVSGNYSNILSMDNSGDIYVLDDACIYKLSGKTGQKKANCRFIRSVIHLGVNERTLAHHSSLVCASDDNYYVGATYDIGTLAPGHADEEFLEYWQTGGIIRRGNTFLDGVNGQIYLSLGEGDTIFYSYKKGRWDCDDFGDFCIWDDGKSYFMSSNGSGKLLWMINEELFGKPVYDVNNKYIYIKTNNGMLKAIHSDNGKNLWSSKISNYFNHKGSCPAIGSDSTIYIGSLDNNLYAINPDGSKKWAFNTGDDVPSSPVIGSDGTIYVGSNDNNLYAINPDGSKNWSHQIEGSILSVMIGDDGVLYCLSNNSLSALRTSSTGPADSPWPMFGQNAQRTGRAPSPVPDKIQINAFSKSASPFSLTFESKSDSTYIIEASHDLKKWGEIGEAQGTGSSVKFTDPRLPIVPFKRNYFRVKLVE